MDPPTLKSNVLKSSVARVLSFGVLILAVRFAYMVTVKGGSCVSGDFCFRTRRAATPRVPEDFLSATKKWRKSVDYYSSVFQDLVSEGFLFPNSRALCVETLAGEDVLALREIGVLDTIGISTNPTASTPLIVNGEALRQPFENDTFDFEFTGTFGLDRSNRPFDLASEICRTLRPGGFLVVHTATKDRYSLDSLLEFFSNCCRLIRSREIDGIDPLPSIREVVIKKEIPIQIQNLGHEGRNFSPNGNLVNKCSVPGHRREIIQNAEPFIQEEPLKPWITLKRNIKNIKYLTSMVDISFKNRYVYVDVGARNYSSSIGSWFKKQYPKQNKKFEVYAIEADKAFHGEYRGKREVTLLPYAAWVRNETLFFEITWDPSKKIVERGRGGMGRIRPVQSSASYMGDVDKIQGIDFAGWLKRTVSERDFVVVKMDVEGAEFHLVPRLIETGAICLIDEIFLECHYNRWQRCCPGQRSVKYQKTYAQCMDLFTSLRENGVLVHQWW
ncbi:hypothetical protein FH972_011786 [Carpinus fangiana]|uniref:DUF7870 domain-containing protein n=1 Tax=Carpinus fangiana TaxID=176857 RepID=A0A660KZD6_9ROSI|nr:hypothetical protein FH972_011786 [Carpinus fangiana]